MIFNKVYKFSHFEDNMSEFYFPDYKGGSTVNLMSSIGAALGVKLPYQNLSELSPEEL